jgi:hypothetical protein
VPENIKEREYQKLHYQENKETISAAKRDRYKEDPTYRNSARKRALSRYHETRVGKERGRRGYNHPKVVQVNGKDVLVHCVKAFADRVGRNVQTIRAWEEREVIPTPTFVDDRNRRWYSDAHIEGVARAVARFAAAGALSLDILGKLVGREFR